MWLSTSFFHTNINTITCFFFSTSWEHTWCYNALNSSWHIETMRSYMLWSCWKVAIVVGRRWESDPVFCWRRRWLAIRVQCFGPAGASGLRTCRRTTRWQRNNARRCHWCWGRFTWVVGGFLLHWLESVHTRAGTLLNMVVGENGKKKDWFSNPLVTACSYLCSRSPLGHHHHFPYERSSMLSNFIGSITNDVTHTHWCSRSCADC